MLYRVNHVSQTILNRVYAMTPVAGLVGCLLCCILFALCYRFFRKNRWWKSILLTAEICSLVIICWITIGQREWGSSQAVSLIPFDSYASFIKGINSEALRSNLMNIILFMPFALLRAAAMEQKKSRKRAFLETVLICILLSTGIEILQYVLKCGITELDDVIDNTVGGILGAGIFYLVEAVTEAVRNQRTHVVSGKAKKELRKLEEA
ncbi:MAG: VanZ family protein [Eubacteriales bacterium]|nr:VanZ family protein [Eubacteriales bacterium]